MTSLTIQSITKLIPPGTRNIYIGYSGGIDSHVLLHLCASDPAIRTKTTAVYVHHGLQQAADGWGEHCRQQCLDLSVAFSMIKVNATADIGESPEAAARHARYTALQSLLQPGDVLLLAQHREDQMETLLLQLFRGAGVHGLSGMPVSADFGQGLMFRPLLNASKQDILDYALLMRLSWVDDPSNFSDDYDRNFLRNQIVPLLKQRWPALDKTVARSASHCADAGLLLDEWMEASFGTVFDPLDQGLLIGKWRQFEPIQRDWLLRHWLRRLGLRPPSQAVLQSIVEQVIGAKDDANPIIHIQQHCIRKYRQKLFAIPKQFLLKEPAIKVWQSNDEVLPMMNSYRLIRIEASSGIDKRLWQMQNVTVGRRQGGEKISLPGREGRHCLKKLYQEAGIAPWERDVRPLIYLNGRLAAVAGLWVDEWAWCRQQDGCYQLLWQP